MNIQELSNKTESNPLIIHINPIGLVRMGSNNEDIFLNLNSVLNEIQDCNGNVAIPVYSYSYAKNEIFDVHADISKMRSEFNWIPKISLKKGLGITYNSFR